MDPGRDILQCPYRIGYFMLPIEWAAYGADPNTLRLLRQYGAVIKSTYALHMAASSGKLDNLRLIVKAGADINAMMGYDRSECNNTTALHLAASAGRMRNVEYLLANEADSSIFDSTGLKAATAAQRAGHDRIAHFMEGKMRKVALKPA